MGKIRIIGILLILLALSGIAEANEVKFSFDGTAVKKLELHGKIIRRSLCKNKIDFRKYKIDASSVEERPYDTYVSPDETYFVFGGHEAPSTYASSRRTHSLLVAIANCTIVKELEPGHPNAYTPLAAAAFSPDSKKLFVQWWIANGPTRPVTMLTKEYSGNNFETERLLKNMPFLVGGNGFFGGSYRFSKKGDLLICFALRKKNSDVPVVAVYDIARDKILTRLNDKAYFDLNNKKHVLGNDKLPYITKGFLLFNLDIPIGTEMVVINYKTKKIATKIFNVYRGLGMFSFDGERVIFSEFPRPPLWKKKIIVYNTFTGAVIGETALSENEDALDVSSDNTQLIYKENVVRKTINLQPPLKETP